MKTSELIGNALDWAVAKAEYGEEYEDISLLDFVLDPQYGMDAFEPSTIWAQGGPIIEREGIDLLHARQNDLSVEWEATLDGETFECGPTPLVAAMRCFVASKLGNEVDIPEELT